MQRLVLLMIFLVSRGDLFSQELLADEDQKSKKLMVCIAPEFGFIVVHTEQMEHLVQGHSYGLTGQVLFPTKGNRDWERAYNYPEQGVDFYFNSAGNPSQLGYQFASAYFLNLPLNQRKNQLSVQSYRHWLGLGLGAGYSTKKWDLVENHQASVLGSNLNVCLVLQYSALIASPGQSNLRAGLRITHFSNGSYQAPNLGINNAAIFLGYIPRFQNYRPKAEEIKPPTFDHQKKINQSVSLALGIREISPPLGDKYPTVTLGYLFDYRLSYKMSLATGVDAFYNSSVLALMERRDDVQYDPSEAIQVGLVVGTGINFSKFQLRIQQGFYIVDNWGENGDFYHRFGLRYQIHKHWNCSLMLKTHFAKADHGELGVGYTF